MTSQSEDPDLAAVHLPVMADRVVDLLSPALRPDHEDPGTPRYCVDATLGMGGHTLLLLAAHPALRVIGIDRDPDALRIAETRITAAGFADRVTFVRSVNDAVGEVVAERVPGGQADGVLMDLGVSSLQLDETDRGFSYAHDAPLDMRMDPTGGPTAADVVNSYPPGELVRVLREYGEERFATRIVGALVRAREVEPFTTSARLVDLVRTAIPAATRRTGGHPAKRTFQALRIEVNDELGALRRAVPAALGSLAVGGRIVIMSFQSLEDRIVKRLIAPRTESTLPPGLPFDIPGHEPEFGWLTRGSQQADEQELAANPRAAAARLRAAERLRDAA